MKKGNVRLPVTGIVFLLVGVSITVFAFGFSMWGGFTQDTTISASEVSALNTPAGTNVKIDKNSNTIYFYGLDVIIPIIASPENGPMYAFEIYGLVNPKIVVQKGANVTIEFVNGDNDMYHGVVVTPGAPPYYYMGEMMFDRSAFAGSFVQPLPPESNHKFYFAKATFKANISGSFYYICQVPGHAENGMYGQFVVR
ncbi:MAG: hypothetical protein M1542_06110 [Thermotogae bacterium]|jgi:rusticyanin|nr:hypothetical protein [Thermotogota bacterium]